MAIQYRNLAAELAKPVNMILSVNGENGEFGGLREANYRNRGRTENTAGIVKLLLRPRQSRGISHRD